MTQDKALWLLTLQSIVLFCITLLLTGFRYITTSFNWMHIYYAKIIVHQLFLKGFVNPRSFPPLGGATWSLMKQFYLWRLSWNILVFERVVLFPYIGKYYLSSGIERVSWNTEFGGRWRFGLVTETIFRALSNHFRRPLQHLREDHLSIVCSRSKCRYSAEINLRLLVSERMSIRISSTRAHMFWVEWTAVRAQGC